MTIAHNTPNVKRFTKEKIIVQWKCSCGTIGESQLEYWIRCDNPDCHGKNTFQILSIFSIVGAMRGGRG